MGKAGKTLLRVGIFAVFLVAGIFFIGAFRHYETEPMPLSYRQYVAKYGEGILPTNSSKIHLMTASVGMAGSAWAHRFSAPLESMKAYANKEHRLYDTDAEKSPTVLHFKVADEILQPDFRPFRIGYMEWFDLDELTNVLTIRRDHAKRPFIYIDTNSLTYYSWWIE